MGDAEANGLAEELSEVQQRHAEVLAEQLAKAGLLDAMYDAASTGHTSSLCGVFKTAPGRWTLDPGQRQLQTAHSAVLDAQERLQLLSE
jgi:hypothetical protein